MKKLNLAIIGQGRSGKLIHGLYYRSENNLFYNVKYVVEQDEIRRNIALDDYPGCVALSDYHELFGHDDIDIVVNASYSEQHYSICKDLLMHNFNVLTEKPFARNLFECEDLIKTAQKHNVVLAVFQQTNLSPFYEFTKELYDSGKLGEIKQVNIHYSGFAGRWDWQTLQKKLAGSVYNTGPHPLGMAMGLMNFDKDIKVLFSRLDTARTSGDAEDYAKILLSAPGRPLFDIEINSIDAYNDYIIMLEGTKGSYKCDMHSYKMKYILDEESPKKPVQEASLRNANEEPVYCSDRLIWHEEEGSFEGDPFGAGVCKFYENLYHAITEGAPLAINPEDIARLINIIDKTHVDNPLPIKY